MGASLIAITSIFNGLGRFFWGSLWTGRAGSGFPSDPGNQYNRIHGPALHRKPPALRALFCVALLCYGGGFGVMPSFVGDIFGETDACDLWVHPHGRSAAGVAGPQIAAV
jgi:OFA family oxalate/formate antiporter-like MFS transporter